MQTDQQDIRPAYELYDLDGEQPHKIIQYVPERVKVGEFEEEYEDEDGETQIRTRAEYRIRHVRKVVETKRKMGKLVVTAQGNAFHLSDDMVRRMGLGVNAPLVNMATGEEFHQPDRSLKSRALRGGAILPDSVKLAEGGK